MDKYHGQYLVTCLEHLQIELVHLLYVPDQEAQKRQCTCSSSNQQSQEHLSMSLRNQLLRTCSIQST